MYTLGNKNYLAQLWGARTAQDVIRLDNGNTLLACGIQACLLEVDRSGKIVWGFTGQKRLEIDASGPVCHDWNNAGKIPRIFEVNEDRIRQNPRLQT